MPEFRTHECRLCEDESKNDVCLRHKIHRKWKELGYDERNIVLGICSLLFILLVFVLLAVSNSQVASQSETFTLSQLPEVIMALQLPFLWWLIVFLFLWLTKW